MIASRGDRVSRVERRRRLASVTSPPPGQQPSGLSARLGHRAPPPLRRCPLARGMRPRSGHPAQPAPAAKLRRRLLAERLQRLAGNERVVLDAFEGERHLLGKLEHGPALARDLAPPRLVLPLDLEPLFGSASARLQDRALDLLVQEASLVGYGERVEGQPV